MDFCGEQGIPHSVFLGRLPEPDEPYWLHEDREKVIAWSLDKSQRCPSCGTAPWEWDEKRGGRKRAYMPVKHVCQGCNLKDNFRDEKDAKGTYIALIPYDQYMEYYAPKQKTLAGAFKQELAQHREQLEQGQ